MQFRINLDGRARDVVSENFVTVSSGMFGAISISQFAGHISRFEDVIQSAGLRHIRWPGGTIAEMGVVSDKGTLLTSGPKNLPYAYSLDYPDLLHPQLIERGSGVETGRGGLTDALRMAVENGTSFSFVLPTERYEGHPEQARADISAFLVRFFIDRFASGVTLPDDITLDIGNENYDPRGYGQVAAAILQAIKEFRTDHPKVEFKVALQGMQSGADSKLLVETIKGHNSGANLLGQVDVIRLHDLKHTLEGVAAIEDSGPKLWSLRALHNAILEARSGPNNSHSDEIDLYFSAWTVTSDDVASSPYQGLPAAGAMLSLFSGMLELGADYSAAWGFSLPSASDVSMSHIGGTGQQIFSPQAAVFRLMSESLPGMSLIATPYMDGGRDSRANIFTFEDDSKSVIFVAVNDLPKTGDVVRLNFAELDGASFAWAVRVTCDSDDKSVVIVERTQVSIRGNTVTVPVFDDYEVVRIIIAKESPGFAPMHLQGTDGNDRLTGGARGDVLEGEGGADVLFGGGGSDSLDGGQGVDTASWKKFDASLFVDLTSGSAQFKGRQIAVNKIENIITGNGTSHIIGDNSINRIVGGSSRDNFSAQGGNDWLRSNEGKDRLYGGNGNDRVFAGMGHDWVDGGDGDDALVGGWGQDTLIGGEGVDTIYGGRGADILTGGTGADTFILNERSENDTLLDFSVSEGDLIDISAWSKFHGRDGFSYLQQDISQTLHGVIIKLDDRNSIHINDIEVQDITREMFIF
jgi:RTX calcium-binding nonapeptide repeat (4 copies)